MAKLQILRQSGQVVLGQANSLQKNVVSLTAGYLANIRLFAQANQGFALDLTDALSGQTHLLAHLGQGAELAVVQSIAPREHEALAVGEDHRKSLVHPGDFLRLNRFAIWRRSIVI